MEKEKEEIRKEISSILLSTPLSLTISQLSKDYREVIGTSIPYKKFGYNSLELFLQSMPSLEVIGYGTCAQVRARPTAKAAHIDKLVVQQKVNPPKTRKKYERPVQKRSSQSGLLPTPAYPPTYNNNYPKNNYTPPVLNNSHNFQSFKISSTKTIKPLLSIPVPNPYSKPIPATTDNDKQKNISSNNNESSTPVPKTNVSSQLKGINLPPYLELSKPKPSSKTSSKKAVNPQKTDEYSGKTRSFKSNFKNDVETKSQSLFQFDQHSSKKSKSPEIPKVVDYYFTSLSDEIKMAASLTKKSFNEDFYVSDSEDEFCTNGQVPVHVQHNLQALIKNYPDGIWCNDLPSAYKEKYGELLDHGNYGYHSLGTMCHDLDRIFHCIRPDRGDFMLYDKSKPLPVNAENGLGFSDFLRNIDEVDPPKESALGDISDLHFDSDYPPDVVRLHEDLPRQWIPDGTNLMDYIDIDVGEVYDPSKFWIILLGQNYKDKLEAMMNEMQIFYASHPELEIPEDKLELGMYCSAIILEEYHRAVVVNLMPTIEGQVKLFFVDYGTVSPVYSKGICYLHRKFFELPQQAIRARLANIYPPTEKMQWTRESARDFLQMVFQKSLVAQVIRIDERRKALELIIADTTGDDDIFINDKLVEMGHAIFTFQEQRPIELPRDEEPIVRYIHLFPTFDELELGIVPTATQMINLLRTGIELHHIYPQYFKKDYDEEKSKTEKTTNIARYMPSVSEDEFPLLVEDFIDFNEDLSGGQTVPYDNPSQKTVNINDILFETNVETSIFPNDDNFDLNYRDNASKAPRDMPVLYPETLSVNTNLPSTSKSENSFKPSPTYLKNQNDEDLTMKPSSSDNSYHDSLPSLSPRTSSSSVCSKKRKRNRKKSTSNSEKAKIDVVDTIKIKPPPGFESNSNLVNTNTQNIQQNFFFVGNPMVNSMINPMVNSMVNPLNMANFLQQQLLLQQINNQVLLQNFQQQQQNLVMQAQRNQNAVNNASQLAELVSQLSLTDQQRNNVVKSKRKLILEIEFYKQSLHLMRYANNVYCSVKEVQEIYFEKVLPVLQVKRCIAVMDPTIKIENFHKNEDFDLAKALLDSEIVTEEEYSSNKCLLHLLLFNSLPKFVDALSAVSNFKYTESDFSDFQYYLSTYGSDSNVWFS